MIYAIDFDGTLVKHDFPNIGEENTNMVEFVKHLQANGHEWILWTCREGSKLDVAVGWCLTRGLYPTAVNDNIPRLIDEFGNNPRKVFADYYLDDHNQQIGSTLQLFNYCCENAVGGAVNMYLQQKLATVNYDPNKGKIEWNA